MLFALSGFVAAQNKNLRVFCIGNGNTAECPLTSKERGWMQMLPMFLSNEVTFNNYSVSNKSAHAFVTEGHWNNILDQLSEGDYVFIGFDEDAPPDNGAANIFKKDLTGIIEDSKQKKAIPVLFTPVGNMKNEAGSIIQETAINNSVICISTAKFTADIIKNSKLENAKVLNINTAILVAQAAAMAIRDSIPDLGGSNTENTGSDAGPSDIEKADHIALSLKQEAALTFNLRKLPATLSAWKAGREKLKEKILKASGAYINHALPLDVHETGSIPMNGYTIKKIYFQTRPLVYATANLYVPDGKGPFPAVINMHGHWPDAKAGEMIQSRAHELALNGYVCLNIDAWGAGERTTIHGVDEYHGANLGASLLEIGETLLGNQLSDNIRGVDLLSSLKYVDKDRIGATGASGGGNQTMWLSAIDERIKACMPVVSVGTFQSYIMGSNCVCELLPGGLTFTEESGILAMVAPRALKIGNGLLDKSKTFTPAEMIRSYTNAKPVFDLYNKAGNLNYQLFNTPHGYWPEMREAMLGWFDLKLKGTGDGGFKNEIPFTLIPPEKLMVFAKGQRDPKVVTTAGYCKEKGETFSRVFYGQKIIDKEAKRKELCSLLLLREEPDIPGKAHAYESTGNWRNLILETKGHHLVPLTYFPGITKAPVVIILSSDQNKINQSAIVNKYIQKGYGIVLADVWGTGKYNSPAAKETDGILPEYHTLSRAEWWLGHSVMGEWVNDINTISDYVTKNWAPSSLTIDADKELAVAALLQSAINNNIDTCVLRTCPLSYVFDDRKGIDFFNMAIHIPEILQWGDISLIAALSKKACLVFRDPVSISGNKIVGKELEAFKEKFSEVKAACKTEARFSFTDQ